MVSALKANATNYRNTVAQKGKNLRMWKGMKEHNILSCKEQNLGSKFSLYIGSAGGFNVRKH